MKQKRLKKSVLSATRTKTLPRKYWDKDQAKDSDNKARTAENKARTAELRVCILQMLLKGDSIPVIADRLHLRASDVAALIEE